MGRVKLQIKRIENTTNRQVTFSKRRNGLIKKAYELSVLCGVDVALIMFSPSGRLSLFSGNKSIEEILIRYVNLPEHERGRRSHNQELLQRAVVKLKPEHYPTYQDAPSTRYPESQIEDMQQDIDSHKSQIEARERQLRIFEGDYSHITTLSEAEYQEHILKEALKRVQMRKQVLEEKYNPPDAPPPPPPQTSHQVHHLSPGIASANGYIAATEATNNILDWLPRRDPRVQILNFLDSNGLLPLRDHQPTTLLAGQEANLDDHLMSPGSGLEDDSNAQRHEFGQVADVNLGPWTEFYPTGIDQENDSINRASEPRERALLDLYMNPVASSTILAPNQHPT